MDINNDTDVRSLVSFFPTLKSFVTHKCFGAFRSFVIFLVICSAVLAASMSYYNLLPI